MLDVDVAVAVGVGVVDDEDDESDGDDDDVALVAGAPVPGSELSPPQARSKRQSGAAIVTTTFIDMRDLQAKEESR